MLLTKQDRVSLLLREKDATHSDFTPTIFRMLEIEHDPPLAFGEGMFGKTTGRLPSVGEVGK
jgi:hypothetical protein